MTKHASRHTLRNYHLDAASAGCRADGAQRLRQYAQLTVLAAATVSLGEWMSRSAAAEVA